MAIDRALLNSIEAIGSPCFRHYKWEKSIWSFGYSQRIQTVCDTLNLPITSNNLIRRPTGGGIVNHANDWTYALVLPIHHDLSQGNATTSYRAIHQAIANTLNALNITAKLASCPRRVQKSGVCFNEPVAYDVLGIGGKKIAGAAQKRTRTGLLIQGSIDRSIVNNRENEFIQAFICELEIMLNAKAELWKKLYTLQDAINDWEVRLGSKDWLYLR